MLALRQFRRYQHEETHTLNPFNTILFTSHVPHMLYMLLRHMLLHWLQSPAAKKIIHVRPVPLLRVYINVHSIIKH